MPDYEKMLENVKKSGRVRHLAPRQIKLTEGSLVVGKFIEREELESKDSKMPNFYIYTFETSQELVRFPVSGAFDKSMGAQLKPDGIYALEYRGKLDIGKGKEMKEIDVIIIQEPGDKPEPVGEAPE